MYKNFIISRFWKFLSLRKKLTADGTFNQDPPNCPECPLKINCSVGSFFMTHKLCPNPEYTEQFISSGHFEERPVWMIWWILTKDTSAVDYIRCQISKPASDRIIHTLLFENEVILMRISFEIIQKYFWLSNHFHPTVTILDF